MPPKSPALLYAGTTGATPFRFNLHVNDLGHTLIVGPPGAGKSTLLGLIMAQWFRYLRSSCGRRWNDVYSEIKQTLGNAGWGVQHIISAHLDVAIHTYRGVDGSVWVSGKYGVHQVGGLFDDFYVEPETGILREGAQYRKWRSVTHEKERTKPLEFVPIEDGKEYRRIRGIWYLHEFTEVEVKTSVFLRGSFFRMNIETQIISKSKRQLGKKQLKKLGLRNSSCSAGELRSSSTWNASSRETFY